MMFSPIIMKLFLGIFLAISLAQAATSTTDSPTKTAANSKSTSASASMSGSMAMSASGSGPVDNSPEYTITALPAVQSQNSCVFNCLIPIGLADSSGCDDVTENCACLSAPVEAVGFLTDCVATVCKSSTEAFAASATSLYHSYCDSIYGTASISAAVVANENSDAAAAASGSGSMSGMGSGVAMTTTSSSATGTGAAKTSSSASGSSTPTGSTKNDAKSWSPSWFIGSLALGGLAVMIVL